MHIPSWLTPDEVLQESEDYAVTYDSEFDSIEVWRNGRNIADTMRFGNKESVHVASCMTKARAKDVSVNRQMIDLHVDVKKSAQKLVSWLKQTRNLYCLG